LPDPSAVDGSLTRNGQQYGLIFDNVGNRTLSELRRFPPPRLRPVAATEKRQDLVVLTELIESGKVTPVIESTYPLSEAAEALCHYGAGHARGKVIITVTRNGAQERGT
jgi:hypothetical protein